MDTEYKTLEEIISEEFKEGKKCPKTNCGYNIRRRCTIGRIGLKDVDCSNFWTIT